jgi:uncharacterized membrane protein
MEEVVKLLARWLHILSATLAIGGPLYIRMVLLPAMNVLDEEQRTRLREALAARWKIFVHILIVVFLASGLWTFLGVARWRSLDAEAKFTYHLFVGIKLVLALVMFTISSALVGRAALFAPLRQNARLWLTVLVLLGLVMIGLSGTLRYILYLCFQQKRPADGSAGRAGPKATAKR